MRTTLDDLKVLCGYDERNGTSLLGLQGAAEAKGLKAVGMKISVEEFGSFNGPVIAHLWGDHFVVVEPGGADAVMVTDPPNPPAVVKKADFQKAYSGFALLIAKDASAFPKPKDEGPDLRLESYDLDIGSLYGGDKKTYAFNWTTSGPLTIEGSTTGTSAVVKAAEPALNVCYGTVTCTYSLLGVSCVAQVNVRVVKPTSLVEDSSYTKYTTFNNEPSNKGDNACALDAFPGAPPNYPLIYGWDYQIVYNVLDQCGNDVSSLLMGEGLE